jgi:uncharacterized protein YuzE
MPEINAKETEKSVSYDSEDDILFFTKGKPSKYSIEIADFILDVDNKDSLVGIEILNASQALGLPKKLLSSLQYAKVKTEATPNALYVKFLFLAVGQTIPHSVQVPLLPASKREPLLASSWTDYPMIPA